jgi:hypothetical protein
MDLTVLKKKISSYRGQGGKLRNLPDELLMEVLRAWELWTGPGAGFYSALGVDHRKMAGFIGRAKKLKREGVFPESDFKEIKLAPTPGQGMEASPCSGVELVWEGGKVIRFSQVDLLLDFLKKSA